MFRASNLWKIYTSVIGLLCIALPIIFLMGYGVNLTSPFGYIALVSFLGITVLGLCGFSWKIRIGNVLFWKIICWIMLSFGCISILLHVITIAISLGDGDIKAGLISIFGLLFIVPYFLGLYRYAFKSPEIWTKE